jgi:Tol biopolymer transport system component
MSRPEVPVSLADLAAAGVRLRPFEAVTIVRELALQVARDQAPGVPSAHVIRLAPSGAVFIEGPVAAGGRSVGRAAQLLDTLLPGFDAPPEFRAPGALRLVIARALGSVDLPPYATLDAFADALARFGAADAAPVIRQIVSSWAESVASESAAMTGNNETPGTLSEDELSRTERVLESFAPAVSEPETALTVSDVRRARRATGLTLAQISDRSRIPVALLRELEWGYLRNWPSGHYGRTQLVRYARAAGLDEQVVVTTVWPMFDEQPWTDESALQPVAATVESVPDFSEYPNVTWLTPIRPAALTQPIPSRRTRILAALAIPALVALAVAPAVWYRTTLKSNHPQQTAVSHPAVTTDGARETADNQSARSPKVRPSSEPDRLVPEERVPALEAATRQIVSNTHPTQGLTATDVAYSPSFASAGSAMFYHTGSKGPSALMRADTDSSGAVLRITRIVDDSASNFHVRPSPDGTRIAFDSDRDGVRAVYVADADGRHVRRVSGEGFAAVPSWSPDGQYLAFVRAESEHPRVWNLWTTDLTSGDFRRLTNHRVGQPWGASWFPDGKRIAYSLEDRLVLLDLDRGDERVFRTPKAGRLVRTPAVSPDGKRIIFQVRRDGGWLLELDDGSMRKVLTDPTAEEYTWSPDGRRVAYHSGRTGTWGVWVMGLR